LCNFKSAPIVGFADFLAPVERARARQKYVKKRVEGGEKGEAGGGWG